MVNAGCREKDIAHLEKHIGKFDVGTERQNAAGKARPLIPEPRMYEPTIVTLSLDWL